MSHAVPCTRPPNASPTQSMAQASSPIPATSKVVLLVVAHPDDETLFFGPTFATLRARGVMPHVLCMSTGNFDGLSVCLSAPLSQPKPQISTPSSTLVRPHVRSVCYGGSTADLVLLGGRMRWIHGCVRSVRRVSCVVCLDEQWTTDTQCVQMGIFRTGGSSESRDGCGV